MSTYKENFWQGFNIIDKNFNLKRQEFSKLYFMFSRLYYLQKDYKNGLEEVIQSNLLTNEETSLDEALKTFIQQLTKEKVFYEDNINYLKNDILSILENKMNNDNKISLKLKEEQKENEGNFQNVLNELENIKNDYYKKSEIAKISYLDSKIIEATSKKLSKKKIFRQKTEESLKDVENSLIVYEKKIEEGENERIKYINKINDIYDQFQDFDKDLIEIIKKVLTNYNSKISSFFDEQSKLINNNITNIYNNIDSGNDLKIFIEKNKTIGFMPRKIELIKYYDETIKYTENVTKKEIEPNLLNKELKKFLDINENIKGDKDVELQDEFKGYIIKILQSNITED